MSERTVCVALCVSNTVVAPEIDEELAEQWAAVFRREGTALCRFRGRELSDGRIDLADGAQRLEGLRRARVAEIGVDVVPLTDLQMAEEFVSYAVLREARSPIDRAKLLQGALDQNVSHRRLAKAARTNRRDIVLHQALLRLPADAQLIVKQFGILWRSFALLAQLSDRAEISIVADHVANYTLTPEATQELVDQRNELFAHRDSLSTVDGFLAHAGWQRNIQSSAERTESWLALCSTDERRRHKEHGDRKILERKHLDWWSSLLCWDVVASLQDRPVEDLQKAIGEDVKLIQALDHALHPERDQHRRDTAGGRECAMEVSA